MARPSGLILAGGAAVRLGGGDKTLRRLGGGAMLTLIVERLGRQCSGLVLSANGDPSRFQDFGLPVAADHTEDRGAGPLAGLLAGLDWIAGHRPDADWVLTAPADTPFLPMDLVSTLRQARLGQGAVAACARSGDQRHPLVGLWPVKVRHDLRHALRTEGLRRVGRFLDRHTIAWAEWPILPFDPFLNVNTPEDLDVAPRLATP